MEAKDMPCVTVEQVLRLRDHASSVEHQRDQLRDAVKALMDYGNQYHMDKRSGWAMDKARAALKATEEG